MSRMVVSLLVAWVIFGVASPCPGASASDDPPPIAPPRPPDFKGGWYRGTVVKAGADGIEIDGSGGIPIDKRVKLTGRRSFTLSAPLRAGGYDEKSPCGRAYSYRVQDLQVGDTVEINYARSDGVEICTEICISKRPGGRVPPAPGEKEDAPYKWHEYQNAMNDWVDHGIPLPEKFRPKPPPPPVSAPPSPAKPAPLIPPAKD